MYAAVFVVSLVLAIMFHEFGHYATAKAFGMKVERFFLGFGPTLWSFQRGETEYGVKAIPAGGFVKITGHSRFEDIAEQDRPRAFYNQPAWQRFIVLAAGSFTHFIVAVLLLFAALAFIGAPVASNLIEQVAPGTPADEAGLREGDRIVAADGVPVGDFEAVRDIVTARGGERMTLVVERDGERLQVQARIAEQTPDGQEVGFLGVAPAAETRRYGVAAAAREVTTGDLSIATLTRITVGGLAQALSPAGLAHYFSQVGSEGPRDPEGPISVVGIGQTVQALGSSGDVFAVLAILAQLNIVLGVLNMLPLPPLDGGHVMVMLVEKGVNGWRRLRGRRADWSLDPAVVTPIALAVILLFTMLTVTAVYLDIVKPASELVQ
ncbi:MAG TPA: M50 family metallopeptidase [Egibacteraceae bacterium]|nr:M50 family metallopeptidase [Egibacteraceae bacterium]